MDSINYHTTKTTDLEALAAARGIAVPATDGKTERDELIALLKRDDAEQAALREDANGGPAAEPAEGAGDEPEADDDAGDDAAPKKKGKRRLKVPGAGEIVVVVMPDGSEESAEVIAAQDDGTLELRCTPAGAGEIPGVTPYHRTGCRPWSRDSRAPGWRK